jgi:hypothetical protein
MLGTQPVVDGDHCAAREIAQLPAQRVVGIEIADHPATAVVVDEHGCG